MTSQQNNEISVPKIGTLSEDFTFWNGKLPRVGLINNGDFKLGEFNNVTGLQIADMTTVNKCELENRQALVSNIMDNEKLRHLIKHLDVSSLGAPDLYNYLTHYNSNRTPLWVNVAALLDIAEQSEVYSVRLQTFISFLKSALQLEETERQVANKISDVVKRMAIIEGTVSARIKYLSHVTSADASDCVGYARFSENLSGLKQLPDWITKWRSRKGLKCKLAVLAECYIEYCNNRVFMRAAKGQELDAGWQSLLEAGLTESIDHMFYNFSKSNYYGSCDHVNLKIAVRHDKRGNFFRVTSVDIDCRDVDYAREDFLAKGDDRLLSKEAKSKLIVKRAEVALRVSQRESDILTAQLHNELRLHDEHFFDWRELNIPEITQMYGWSRLEDLQKLPELCRAHEAVESFRNQVIRLFGELVRIEKNLTRLEACAKEYNFPLTMPRIAEGNHIVAFKRLLPVHICNYNSVDKKSIVPITGLEPLGSSVVCVTGHHGGGKTVTLLTVAQMLVLAHTGFPVFGTEVEFALQEQIGLVLLGNGENGSSTKQQMLVKITNLTNAIADVTDNQIVLFIDELGSGTQESVKDGMGGLELGKILIDGYKNAGVSVFLTTQIQQLAQHALDIGATCYRINRLHQISIGIGDGDLGGMGEAKQLLEALDKLSSRV